MLIQLRPFTVSDIPNLIAWVDKPGSSDLWASRTYPYPLTEKIILNHMLKTKKVPCELLIFKILAEGIDNPVGHIELDKFDHDVKSSRITRLFVDPKYRNCGFGRRATYLLLQLCFEELGLNRVEILALETNEIALKLYEKIGFVKEGFLRENMLLNGEKQGSHPHSFKRP